MQQLIAITATTASILLQNFTPLHKVLASEHRLSGHFPVCNCRKSTGT